MKTEKKRLKIGVIGAGFIGQLAHIENYAVLEQCEIVALAELRPQLRQRVAQKYNIPRSYAIHTDLLKDEEVEAVIAVTQRSMTGLVAHDTLQAKKHLLTEKPMAGNYEQAKKLVNLANTNNLNYTIGYMKRYDEGVQKARKLVKQLVESNELGPITFVRSHCFQGDSYCNSDTHIKTRESVPTEPQGWPIAPEWLPQHLEKEYASFLNRFCHSVNLLRYLLNQTPEVQFVNFKNRDGRMVVLDFGSFVTSLEVGDFTYQGWDDTTEIYFKHGCIKLTLPPPLLRNVPAKVVLYKSKDTPELYIPQSSWSWSFRRQSEAFVDSIINHQEPLTSGADSLNDHQLIETMWKQALSHL